MNTIRRAVIVPFFLIFILALFAHDSFSLSQFANYQSATGINDIVSSGLQTWVACSGGLFAIDFGKNSFTLYNNINDFPDVNLTAVCRDPKGNLWIGSKLGYLYKQTPDGKKFVYDSYFGSNWEILALFPYNDYLIVGSTKGASIFDPVKELALGNTSTIDTFSDPAVFSIAVHNDSLYIGCKKGYASAYIAGNRFLANNYADPSLWHSTPTGQNVVSFIDSSGVFLPRADTAVLAGQTYYHAGSSSDTFFVKVKDSIVFTAPSKVTKLVKDDYNNLWIGTAKDYLYFLNNAGPPGHLKIPGLTFDVVTRVHAAKNGIVWLEPNCQQNLSPATEPWFDGVTSFDGKTWTLYSHYTAQNFGFIGSGGNFQGICEDRSGNMWFSASGGNVKKFDAQTKQWSEYYMPGMYMDTAVRQLSTAETSDQNFWGKNDAICQDSSGNMWYGNWEKANVNYRGCLICTDPSVTNYKRFYPLGDQYCILDIFSLCVDSRGKILVGGNDGELLIVSHKGHPLQDGIDSIYLFRKDFGKVFDMCATSNGITWIVTEKGLYKYNSDADVLDSLPTSKIPATINCIDAESDGLLWLGTSADGIIRYTVSDSTKTTFSMSNGLVSNSVNDLSIDKAGGYLWVATNAGLSRMSLGHTSALMDNNKNIVAYPNPFSQTNPNHREIIFKHCAPDIKIYVYTLSGTLVKKLSRDADNAYPTDNNPYEATLRWVPSKKLVPGTYYFVGQPQQPTKTQKLLIIP
jgi:Two component regulator propeller.